MRRIIDIRSFSEIGIHAVSLEDLEPMVQRVIKNDGKYG
jgi:hypothetical protein